MAEVLSGSDKGDEPMWGRPVNGLRMACVAEAGGFRRYERVRLRLILENVQPSGEVAIEDVRPFVDYKIEVADGDGRLARLTETGEARLSPFLHKVGGRIHRVLGAGETLTLALPLSDYFSLERPGDYLANVSRPTWKDKDGPLAATPCRFRVI